MGSPSYCASYLINGAALHTEINARIPREWYAIRPERANNKTNGVTSRRWLKVVTCALAAPPLDEVTGSGRVFAPHGASKFTPSADPMRCPERLT